MIQSKKKWTMHTIPQEQAEQLAADLQVDILVAKLLISRGLDTAESANEFLKLDESAVHDPFLFSDMKGAVERIQSAIAQNEKILVYGDYDADGITSVTVLMETLTSLGANVSFKIPNRFTDGYGPSERLFRLAHEEGVTLLITVDNGISGVEQIKVAKELGMDVILTDHHEAGETLPPADFLIHPHLEEAYPFSDLAGVGVAFKLAQALLERIPEELMYLVAIGTIADIVPLRGENRYFVKRGLELLRKQPTEAIRALASVSGVEIAEINEETIGFAFGPRINAVGRLGDADPGVHFFRSASKEEASLYAKFLQDKNKERQAIVKAHTDEAIAQVEAGPIPSVIIVAQEEWNPGILGIVASRLVEKYTRPTIVLGVDLEKGIAKGSARSIEGFHLYQEIAKNRDLVPHFGGHPMAAGMTLPLDNLDEFIERMQAQGDASLTQEHFTPQLTIDVPISLSEVTVEAIENAAKLGPFGMGFTKPVYVVTGAEVKSFRKIGAASNHAKLEVQQDGHVLDIIGFHQGNLVDQLAPMTALTLAGDLQINEWNGRKKAQMMLEDAASGDWQLFDVRGIRQLYRWLNQVPDGDAHFVAFHDQTIETYQDQLPVAITKLEDFEAQHSSVVLLDMPDNEGQLDEVMKKSQWSRVFAHFFTPSQAFFDGLPSRDQFKWYYGFLMSKEKFALKEQGAQLARHKGWSEQTINFMSKVFFELDFVKIDNGHLVVNKESPRRDLSEAPSYQQQQQRIELEQVLLYAPYRELKQWFDAKR
ncbi:single-stranded-DNA-specific exonuclease RecJ [Chryseomicrobium sp. FSL W7-1435]|uniref:single-stranded-DNA-specific exonuclease RecJ n=1 Tax=Chryseomicrobium sp. FSL W7-1435 TaxID=2921704 RepID=UPI003159C478